MGVSTHFGLVIFALFLICICCKMETCLQHYFHYPFTATVLRCDLNCNTSCNWLGEFSFLNEHIETTSSYSRPFLKEKQPTAWKNPLLPFCQILFLKSNTLTKSSRKYINLITHCLSWSKSPHNRRQQWSIVSKKASFCVIDWLI